MCMGFNVYFGLITKIEILQLKSRNCGMYYDVEKRENDSVNHFQL